MKSLVKNLMFHRSLMAIIALMLLPLSVNAATDHNSSRSNKTSHTPSMGFSGFELNDLRFSFTLISSTDDPLSGDHLETFDSVLVAQSAFGPVEMTGQTSTVIKGEFGQDTGTWDTEMLSMDLSGQMQGGPFIMIRLDAANPTLGETTITDIGGGQYHIDSFFDVFTEISIDGGASWDQSIGSSHMVSEVPVPAAAWLFGSALIGLAGIKRKK
jgi:hypothetical protein